MDDGRKPCCCIRIVCPPHNPVAILLNDKPFHRGDRAIKSIGGCNRYVVAVAVHDNISVCLQGKTNAAVTSRVC